MIRHYGGSAFDLGTAYRTDDFAGCAFWLAPGESVDEQALGGVLEAAVEPERLGVIFDFMKQVGASHPGVDHWHLPGIGVDPSRVPGSRRRRALALRPPEQPHAAVHSHAPCRDDDSLRAEMATVVLPYARSFDARDVASCEFMLARQKVQWYLIVNERWEDLIHLQAMPEPTSTPTAAGDQLDFDYASLVPGLPEEICRQFRFKVAGIRANLDPPRNLVVHAEVPAAMETEPLHVIFRGPGPDTDVRVPITDVSPTDTGLTFAVRIPPGVDESSMPRLRLGLETRGRFTTQKITLDS